MDILAAVQDGGQRRPKRRLTPQEKYQVWQEVVAGQGTQREIADRWGIDRSTVMHIVKLAKQDALERLAMSRPTPDDEHQGRGDHIRQARREGLRAAREQRIAYRRQHHKTAPDRDGEFLRPNAALTRTHLSGSASTAAY